MDKINKIKNLVEISLNTVYGVNLTIKEILVIPTHSYDEDLKDWIPDSHTVFLSIENKSFNPCNPYNDDLFEVSHFLESLLGLDICLDFV